ncbi:MAG TPA: response regulator [Myxococcota bacterium]|nr:response regulator [Myxococcota bacterium]
MSTILLVEGSESRRAQIHELVERCGLFARVLEARDGREAERALRGQGVDVVLCDLETPGVSGEGLLQLRGPATPQTSFLFLSAPANLAQALQRFDHEACDVVPQTVDATDLTARLRLQLRLGRLRNEVLEKSAQLEQESTLDLATGLRSRVFMQEALRVETLRAQRHRMPLSIVRAELDPLPQPIDPSAGRTHETLLRHTASFVRKNLRVTDLSGRFGGEEFLVILPHTPIAGGIAVAEFWREMVAKHRVSVPEGGGIDVTISLGVADWRPTTRTQDELLKVAEEGLRAARAKGGNCAVALGA